MARSLEVALEAGGGRQMALGVEEATDVDPKLERQPSGRDDCYGETGQGARQRQVVMAIDEVGSPYPDQHEVERQNAEKFPGQGQGEVSQEVDLDQNGLALISITGSIHLKSLKPENLFGLVHGDPAFSDERPNRASIYADPREPPRLGARHIAVIPFSPSAPKKIG